MDRLVERCILLRAAFTELQGGAGRRHQISDANDWPAGGRTDHWKSWSPWVSDSPHGWGAYVLARCGPLREAVAAIRGARAEVDATAWTSPVLERAFRVHLEHEVLGRPWLADIEDGHFVGSGQDADWVPSDELYLVTLPASLSSLDSMVAMAKEVAVNENQQGTTPILVAQNRPAVSIPDANEFTIVYALDQVVRLPSPEMGDLIREMLLVYPDGLGLAAVRSKNTKGDVRLRELTKANRYFAAAVALPGGPRKGGYRIRSVDEANQLLTTAPPPAAGQS